MRSDYGTIQNYLSGWIYMIPNKWSLIKYLQINQPFNFRQLTVIWMFWYVHRMSIHDYISISMFIHISVNLLIIKFSLYIPSCLPLFYKKRLKTHRSVYHGCLIIECSLHCTLSYFVWCTCIIKIYKKCNNNYGRISVYYSLIN